MPWSDRSCERSRPMRCQAWSAGADAAAARRGRPTAATLERDRGADADLDRVVIVGAFIEVGAAHVLPRVADRAVEIDPGAEIVVGGGDHALQREVAVLAALVLDVGLVDRIADAEGPHVHRVAGADAEH